MLWYLKRDPYGGEEGIPLVAMVGKMPSMVNNGEMQVSGAELLAEPQVGALAAGEDDHKRLQIHW